MEELEECNIFPPQVTQAAHRLRRAGRLPADILLPTTVEGGKTAFAGLHYISRERPAPAVPDGESAVSFQDVSLAYRSVKGEPHTVFDGLDLNIRKGEKVALIGSNGAGKSTLMKLMVGLLKPNSGTVSLFGEAIGDKKAEDLSRQISLVYQNPEEMFIKDSIRADIAYAMEVRNVSEWEKRTAELLERFRLTELQDRDGRLMSGGQMRRASLAIGIALNPGILLLDEPTANLDIATRREIMDGPGRHEGHHSDRRHRNPRYAAGVPVGGADHRAVRRACGGGRRPGRDLCPGRRGGAGGHPPAGDLLHGAGFRQAGPVLYH